MTAACLPSAFLFSNAQFKTPSPLTWLATTASSLIQGMCETSFVDVLMVKGWARAQGGGGAKATSRMSERSESLAAGDDATTDNETSLPCRLPLFLLCHRRGSAIARFLVSRVVSTVFCGWKMEARAEKVSF